MKTLLTLLLFSAAFVCFGQNLLPNPDFENANCNDAGIGQYGSQQFFALEEWFRPFSSGTPNYFNSCYNDNAPSIGIPSNIFGFEDAFNGDGYVGLGLYEPESSNGLANEVQEFLSNEFSEPLIAGMEYRLSFWLSLSDSSSYKTNRLSAYFTEELYEVEYLDETFEAIFVPDYQLEILGLHEVSKDGWYYFEGTYVALGGERFITIGEFENNDNIDAIYLGEFQSAEYAYYYMDGVQLVSNGVSVKESVESSLEIWPNPVSRGGVLNIRGLSLQEPWVIFNSTGQLVMESSISSDGQFVIELEPGMYFVRCKSGSIIEKLIVKE